MCGRYSLAKDQKYLERRFGVKFDQEDLFKARYNIPPSSDVPTILFSKNHRLLEPMKWGILRQWDKERAPVLISNLRAEKLAKGPFRTALTHRRCMIPVDGFYEWKMVKGKKHPVRFTMKDDEAFAFPAIYDEPNEDMGPPVRTFSIFTIEPNPLVAKTHDRMPCILRPEQEDSWLDPSLTDLKKVLTLLEPYPADRMKAHDVSPALNSPANDSPDVIKPVAL